MLHTTRCRTSASKVSLRALAAGLLALSGLGVALPVHADRIHLTNGRVLEGHAVRTDDGRVEIHSSVGVVTLAANQVSHIERSETHEARAERLIERSPDDAEALFALALDMKADGAETLARRLLERVIDLDPDHAGARRELGFRLHEGQWVTRREFHELRGEVLYRGEYVTVGERAQLIQTERDFARQTLDLRRRQVLDSLLVREALAAAAAPSSSTQSQAPATQGIPLEWVLSGPAGPVVQPIVQPPPRTRQTGRPPAARPRGVRTTAPRPVETTPAHPPANRGRFRRN